MKKRIPALCLALILTLLCMPLSVSAEENSGNAAAVLYDEADDFARFGKDEEYAIVPCCAGSSCVDLHGNDGKTLQIYRSARHENQIWTVGKVGDYYYFKNKWNGKAVDVPNSSAAGIRELQCYGYHGGDNQLWRLERMGDGTYSIHSKLNDSMVWYVRGGLWDDGTVIQLHQQNRTPAQRFRFVHVSTTEPTSEWGASRHDCSGSNWSIWNGSQQDRPAVTVKTYTEETLILTNSIDRSYTVRAVFNIYDDTPDDMKVNVKLELECTNGVDGWNSDIVAAELVDSAGEKHRWDIKSTSLDEWNEKVSHDFYLGTTSPVAVYISADFGGGFTFHDYGLKARMWVNGSGKAIESTEATLNSYPFMSSTYSENYMHISFENFGNSVVGGTSYTTCSEAWDKAKSDSSLTVRLESAWLLDKALEVGSGQTVNLDLNGYPVIRTIKKTDNNGELFLIREGGTLNISDSTPIRQSSGLFTGGSIQGGRSWDTAGLIECKGTLVMNGGTLYNGGANGAGDGNQD